jgi:hypothetical protein
MSNANLGGLGGVRPPGIVCDLWDTVALFALLLNSR